MKDESLDFFFYNFFLDKWFMSLQKIYDIYTHEVVGGELLLRVFDEEILDNGIYFPEAFSDNRFNNLTLDILFKLKKYLVTSPEIFPDHVSFNFVPINIESIEIHKSLVEITEIFNRLNKNLVLEISEIFTHSDYIKFLPIAENLKDAGAQIGLDDYGATDIEIDALDFFPLDFVKLDRSISISEDALKSSFHRKMISIANKRNLTLIAEGVEDNETINLLKSYGYRLVQGYYFHKPEKFIS